MTIAAPALPPLTYDEVCDAMTAVDEGRLTELEHCSPCSGARRGVVLRGVAGVADPTEWRRLNCGHVAI